MSTFEEADKPVKQKVKKIDKSLIVEKVGFTLRAESSSNLGGHPTQSTTCFAINNDGTILALGASDLTTVSIFAVSGVLPTEDNRRFSFTDTERNVVRPDDHRTFIPHQNVRSIAFHPLFPVLATGSDSGTVKLWRMLPTDIPKQLRTRDDTPQATQNVGSPINSVAFHPTEMRLATCSKDNTTQVWSFTDDYNNLICLATLNHGEGINHVVNVVAFHPTQRFLATGCDGADTSRLWKLAPDNSTEHTYTILHDTAPIKSLAFHPSGKLLATGDSGRNLKLWDFNNYDTLDRISCVNTFTNHTNAVVSVVFHPTKPFLATGSWDRTAKVWTYSSNGLDVKCVATHEYTAPNNSVNSVAFYPVPATREEIILAIGRSGGMFETYKLTGVSSGGTSRRTRRRTRRRTPRRHRRRTHRRRSRKQQRSRGRR